MPTPDWLRSATEPTDDEVRAVTAGRTDPARLRELSEATEPLDDEVHAVLARGFAPAPRRATWAAPLALAALVLVVIGAWLARPEPPWRMGGSARWAAVQEGPVTVVTQQRGLAAWEVDPVAPSGHFQVRAGDVTVTVLGTVFLVDHQPPEVTVEVREGRVQIDHPWGRTILSRGERWVRSEEAARHRVDDAVDVLLPGRTVAVLVPTAPVRTPRPEAPAPAEDPGEALADLITRVEAGERSDDLLAALESFARGLPEAHPLAGEARTLAMVVGADVWPADTAMVALDAWLVQHPRHPHRTRLVEARATVARARLQRCDLALPDYRVLAAGPRGPASARAAAWQGLCAASLGMDDEAANALDAALERGVTGELRAAVLRARRP
ncbi:MAG: FecR domain-containing protein [Alphaproteobacteria bacterium]|nr:FecR domain-containing protein [Alphaproteobacteria bacterium]